MSSFFWADKDLPHLEARFTKDGQSLKYGMHSHAELSVALIEAGQSYFCAAGTKEIVGPGDLMIINPGLVHACQPLKGVASWGYSILFVDIDWLAALQVQDGSPELAPIGEQVLRSSQLSGRFRQLLHSLAQPDVFEREQYAIEFLSALYRQGGVAVKAIPNGRLQRAIEFMHDRFTERLRLDEVAKVAELSPNHFTRLFRDNFGLTPHSYLIDLRIQRSRWLLRRAGLSLAEIALASGFSDQAHWQRHYRRRLAITPGCLSQTDDN
jgi:AraC-like DNA-binding protein